MQERMWHFLPWGFPTWRQGNGGDDLGTPSWPHCSSQVAKQLAGEAAAEVDLDGFPCVYLSLRWPCGVNKGQRGGCHMLISWAG